MAINDQRFSIVVVWLNWTGDWVGCLLKNITYLYARMISVSVFMPEPR